MTSVCSHHNRNDKQFEKINEKNVLQNLPYYHGVQTKEDIALIMKDAGVGDYLLRASFLKSELALVIFLCVKVSEKEDDIHHYLLDFNGERFSLRQKTKEECSRRGGAAVNNAEPHPFTNYEEMTSYYKVHRLACGIRLSRALKRPKWQLRHSDVVYSESDKLGEGNFCKVYRGKYVRKSEEEKDVAIKVSKDTDRDPAALMETRNLLIAEAKIMINYKHLNVVKLWGFACDMPPFMVCMEFCHGGSLENHLYKNGKEMEEFERQTLLIDTARGMRYLHTQKCIHRDLASRNCLISVEGYAKIADFGLSKTLSSDETAIKECLKEAPLVWMAPECIQKESEFSFKTDVWAYGVLIYEVYFNGEKPFADEKDTGVIVKAIRRAKMPTIESKTEVQRMEELLASIWTKKPEDRPDFQKILEKLVEALVPGTMESVRKMQVNKLPGVTRKKLPNVNTDQENIASVAPAEFEVSEKVKRTRGDREKTKRRTRKRRTKSNLRTSTEVDEPVPRTPVRRGSNS